jgi:hypothetical protein
MEFDVCILCVFEARKAPALAPNEIRDRLNGVIPIKHAIKTAVVLPGVKEERSPVVHADISFLPHCDVGGCEALHLDGLCASSMMLYGVARHEPAPVATETIFCALTWCQREHEARIVEKRGSLTIYVEEDAHCSPRCREYDARKKAVERRFIDFAKREKYKESIPTSEWAWARDKRDAELEPIERQFRSLSID